MQLSSKEREKLKQNYGQWAVITGATSGIGKELAIQLSYAGLNLVLCGRNQEALDQLQDKFAKNNHDILVLNGDLNDSEFRKRIIQETQHLDIGLFIASAGLGTSGTFVDQDLDEVLNMIHLNCNIVVEQTHYFANRFKQQNRGGIILLSSILAFQGVPFSSTYGASKSFIHSFAEALSFELKPFGVDVLGAAPGPVHSKFAERANMIMDLSMKASEVSIPILKALGKSSTTLPGFLSRFLTYSLHTAPRWGRVRLMSIIMGGMTKHQRG